MLWDERLTVFIYGVDGRKFLEKHRLSNVDIDFNNTVKQISS
jgi:hypothetical protein